MISASPDAVKWSVVRSCQPVAKTVILRPVNVMIFSSRNPLPDNTRHRHTARLFPVIRVLCLLLLPVSTLAQEPSNGSSTDLGIAAGIVDQPADREDRLEAATAFARAKLLADEGSLGAALEAYQKSIALDGSDPYGVIEVARFHVYLAQIARDDLQQKEHLETAADYAEAARALAPDALDVLDQYAQVHLRLTEQNRYESLEPATEAFERLVAEKDEPRLQTLLSLGQLYLWRREGAKAVPILRQAAGLRPRHPTIRLMLVEALMESGETREAETVLEELLDLDPSASDRRVQLAELRSQRGDHRGAVDVLRAGSPEWIETSPRVRQLLARELHLSGDNEAALALSDSLLAEQTGRGTTLRRLRVAIFSSLARYEDAVDELRPLIEESREADRIVRDTLLMGRLLERLGRADEATERLQELLATSLSDGADLEQLQRIELSLIGIWERQGEHDRALDMLGRRATEAPSREASMLYRRLQVEMLTRIGRLDDALALLTELANGLPPEDPRQAVILIERLGVLEAQEQWDAILDAVPPLVGHGTPEIRQPAMQLELNALAHTGRLDEALARLGEPAADAPAGDAPVDDDSSASEPSSPEDQAAKAEMDLRLAAARIELMFEHGREDEAVTRLRTLAAEGDERGRLLASQLFQRFERYDEAIPLLEGLLDANPESTNLLFLLGASRERAGDIAGAEVAFQELLALEPDFTQALNYLGYMWAERGEHLEDALRMIRRAVAREPDNGAYVDSLGWVLHQMGRHGEARSHLEWAARLMGDDPTVLEHLGDLYVALEETELARQAYRQVLGLETLEADKADAVRRKLEALDGQGGS